MEARQEDPAVRAADAIVAALEAAGVQAVFGIPGVHNLALFDALGGSRLGTVITRHEGAAAHAADGHARVTGRPGVVLTTTGPGAANALAGVGEAWAAGSPVLHLTTQVSLRAAEDAVQRGLLHQSPDQLESFRSLTRFAARVTSAESAADVVAEALAATVTGRHRPAYVEVPFDLLDAPGRSARDQGSTPATGPDPARVAEAAALLARAERVVLWAGGGVVQAEAGQALLRVARRLAAPVVTTFMGAGAVSADDPLAVGLPPAEPLVENLLRSADALLAVGTSFRGTVTMNGALEVPATVIQVDVDLQEIGKAYPALGVAGDATEVLGALDAALVELGVDRSDRAPAVAGEVAALRRSVWDELASDPLAAGAVAFLRALRAGLPPEGVVVADMCIAGYWCGGYLPLPGPNQLFYPVGWGTLGCGLPAAVGAATARRGPVVAVLGDAGFLFYPAELATAREHGLDLVALVVNDEGYGMLRVGEELTYGRTFAADLVTPDFATLASAFGIPYASASFDDGSLESAIRAAVEAGGPHVIEVRAALYPPRSTSPRWPKRDPK